MENKDMTNPNAGVMSDNGPAGSVPAAIHVRFNEVLAQWQAAVNADHTAKGFTNHPADQVHGHYGAKYARLDVGGSGAFMVEIATGIVYGIKGYGVVDKKKISGNIFNPLFNGSVLVRDRFRRGRFMNHTDGTPMEAVR